MAVPGTEVAPARSANDAWPALPEPLSHLAAPIAASRALLDLPDDWDDDGAAAFAEATWDRAVGFVVGAATRLWADHGVRPAAIDVLPGTNGSIGIDWRTTTRELLITVPADPKRDAPFYGDDGAGGRKIKGTLDLAAPNRWLVAWLAE